MKGIQVRIRKNSQGKTLCDGPWTYEDYQITYVRNLYGKTVARKHDIFRAYDVLLVRKYIEKSRA